MPQRRSGKIKREKSLSLKLPSDLDTRLEDIKQATGVSKAALAEDALEVYTRRKLAEIIDPMPLAGE